MHFTIFHIPLYHFRCTFSISIIFGVHFRYLLFSVCIFDIYYFRYLNRVLFCGSDFRYTFYIQYKMTNKYNVCKKTAFNCRPRVKVCENQKLRIFWLKLTKLHKIFNFRNTYEPSAKK